MVISDLKLRCISCKAAGYRPIVDALEIVVNEVEAQNVQVVSRDHFKGRILPPPSRLDMLKTKFAETLPP